MKRDFFLIRRMLTAVEDAQPGEPIQNFQYDGVDARTIAEHVKLLQETKGETLACCSVGFAKPQHQGCYSLLGDALGGRLSVRWGYVRAQHPDLQIIAPTNH